jgi:hypothetical protein
MPRVKRSPGRVSQGGLAENLSAGSELEQSFGVGAADLA